MAGKNRQQELLNAVEALLSEDDELRMLYDGLYQKALADQRTTFIERLEAIQNECGVIWHVMKSYQTAGRILPRFLVCRCVVCGKEQDDTKEQA